MSNRGYESFLGTCFLTGIVVSLSGLIYATFTSDFNAIMKTGIILLIIPFLLTAITTFINDIKDEKKRKEFYGNNNNDNENS